MRATSLIRALQAMASMEKGKPYALRPEDAKRRLANELARICEETGLKPVVIGGLAVNHHGYMRVTADVDVLVARSEAIDLYRRLRSAPAWRRHAEGFKNTELGVALDVHIEGERTAPGSTESSRTRPSCGPSRSVRCPFPPCRSCSPSKSCRAARATMRTWSSC